jgi:regulatory protein YycI of two-component signal transduction system YycFG
MTSKIKNIIIFTVITALLILAYIFFIKPSPEEKSLVFYSPSNTELPNTNTLDQNSLITQDLLSVLLSVKSIKLDDAIFSDEAFINLKDSSILLTSPGDEGRLNPFAPIGFDIITTPVIVPPVIPVIPPEPIPATPKKP